MNKANYLIVGGGIVGLATAMHLAKTNQGKVIVIETEPDVARHQTGHNSGVIHSGLYYKPGSAKAKNCAEGREAMYQFCADHGIAHERCGKIVVATDNDEIPRMEELLRRGIANGLTGIRTLCQEELREHEPHVAGIKGLFVPQTGIVNYKDVSKVYQRLIAESGGEVQLGCKFLSCKTESGGLVIETTKGTIQANHLINCGGLHSDRIAKACGVEPGVQIVPFRGEYYELHKDKHYLVRNLIYPVPDPRLPFLGVHLTRMVHGGVEAGPNAVLAFRREGYKMWDFSIRDMIGLALSPGFWRMSAKFWKTGIGEFYRSLSKKAFLKALQRLMPELQMKDIYPAGAGVRAQAMAYDGKLVDDFHIVQKERMVHVLNAPSPAATASLAIGKTISELANQQSDSNPKTISLSA
ncbi:MAG: L-2-hydroxyglutarate oxidase LhgO [Planctomycetota bacterium]|jgi:L-2-hydroxyglutarate oxidase